MMTFQPSLQCSGVVCIDSLFLRVCLKARDELVWISNYFSPFWVLLLRAFLQVSVRFKDIFCCVERLHGFPSGSGRGVFKDFLWGIVLLGVLELADPPLGYRTYSLLTSTVEWGHCRYLVKS